MVKRYNVGNGREYCWEWPDGTHVLYSDYAALKASHDIYVTEAVASLNVACAEVERLRAEIAKLKSDLEKADVEAKLLKAACGQMRTVLERAADWFDVRNPAKDSLAYAVQTVLSTTDAGRNYIDATWAVEGKVAQGHLSTRQVWTAKDALPDDWAGSKVLIVRKP